MLFQEEKVIILVVFDNIGEPGWTNYSGEYEAGRVFQWHKLVRGGVTKIQNNYINNTGDVTINFWVCGFLW